MNFQSAHASGHKSTIGGPNPDIQQEIYLKVTGVDALGYGIIHMAHPIQAGDLDQFLISQKLKTIETRVNRNAYEGSTSLPPVLSGTLPSLIITHSGGSPDFFKHKNCSYAGVTRRPDGIRVVVSIESETCSGNTSPVHGMQSDIISPNITPRRGTETQKDFVERQEIESRAVAVILQGMTTLAFKSLGVVMIENSKNKPFELDRLDKNIMQALVGGKPKVMLIRSKQATRKESWENWNSIGLERLRQKDIVSYPDIFSFTLPPIPQQQHSRLHFESVKKQYFATDKGIIV
ncbi:hypothetical protein FA15DRAFT_699818 [Coprinopsis marcescibilis]|uniref:Uncharacterized protein n=1 Tax=Coprinopsis marcescibilis TaxID=230819 RepID=A0A5C3LC00_COPMA|nr:hypothetical protein FA15DRAFT_699818 [Coprinopsis marcescibilis]